MGWEYSVDGGLNHDGISDEKLPKKSLPKKEFSNYFTDETM